MGHGELLRAQAQRVAITLTDRRLIASAAIIGESRIPMPDTNACAIGIPIAL